MTKKFYKPFYVSDEKKEREFSDTEKSLNDLYEAFNRKIDYNIRYAKDRIQLLSELINENNWIYDLLSTEKIVNNHVKNKKDFLTEDTTFGKIIDMLASYLIHPKYDSDDDFISKVNKNNKEIMTKRREKAIYKKEKLAASNIINKDKEKDSNRKLINVNTKQTINERDLLEYPELKQMQDTINSIRTVLKYGTKMEKLERIKHNEQLEQKYGKRNLNKIKNLHNDLCQDILVAKDKLRGTIYFKRLDKEYTEFNFDSDTGYFNNDGDYIHISENKFDFKNKKHISGLIKFYVDLKDKYKEDFNSSMWSILWSLDELIAQTDFTEKERFVLDLHFQGLSGKEILEDYISFFQEDVTNMAISRILSNNIPNKLQKEYLNQYDEWLYTYKIKGRYKTCNSCGEIKLISNERYFGKDPRNKDGSKSICKKCDTYTKK